MAQASKVTAVEEGWALARLLVALGLEGTAVASEAVCVAAAAKALVNKATAAVGAWALECRGSVAAAVMDLDWEVAG